MSKKQFSEISVSVYSSRMRYEWKSMSVYTNVCTNIKFPVSGNRVTLSHAAIIRDLWSKVRYIYIRDIPHFNRHVFERVSRKHFTV